MKEGLVNIGILMLSELNFFIIFSAGFTFGVPQIHPAFIQRPYG